MKSRYDIKTIWERQLLNFQNKSSKKGEKKSNICFYYALSSGENIVIMHDEAF